MSRSKNVFLVFSIVYIGVALGGAFSLLSITENVLLGLSISSLFISLADSINSYFRNEMIRNDYNYSLSIASEYLQHRIDEGQLSVGNFDICNIKYGIDMLKSQAISIHPVEFSKKKRFMVGNVISTAFFVIGIASFVFLPFIKTGANNSLASCVTVIAFASMCGNIYLNELQNEISNNKFLFDNDKQSLIAALFPNYMYEYTIRTQHLASYNKSQNEKEAESASN